MEIEYANTKIKNEYENEQILSSSFSPHIPKKYQSFKEKIINSNNLAAAIEIYKDMKIKKIKNGSSLWTAKLNYQWYIYFWVNADLALRQVCKIKILEINSLKNLKKKA